MSKTTEQIKQIVALGGNVNIDGSSKTTEQLKQIALVALKSGTTLTIRNAGGKTTEQLKQIAVLLPNKITFEI
nr:hypothetical protein [uncultured Flavobacterium sp.]